MKLKKNPLFNLETSRKVYFQTGLVFALGTALMAFEWSTPFIRPELPKEPFGVDVDIDPIMITERKVDKPKPFKKESSNSTARKEVSDLFREVANNHTGDKDIIDVNLDDPDLWGDEVEDTSDTNLPFMKVESMPHFCSCSKYETNEEREKCTEIERAKYFQNEVKYPGIAKENGIQGKVFVYFEIDEEGKIANAKLENSIHPSLDNEALRVINNLPCYMPGKQRGKTVSVFYYAPIKFVLRN